MIRAKVDGRWRRHIPDYLLIRGAELTFVAVKHWERLNDPKVVEMITWVREVVESGGWAFEVYSALPRPFFDNVRFLAGYRRPQSISREALDEIRAVRLNGKAFGDVVRRAAACEPVIRTALLHMLWTHEAEADLSQVLGDKTVLMAGAVT